MKLPSLDSNINDGVQADTVRERTEMFWGILQTDSLGRHSLSLYGKGNKK